MIATMLFGVTGMAPISAFTTCPTLLKNICGVPEVLDTIKIYDLFFELAQKIEQENKFANSMRGIFTKHLTKHSDKKLAADGWRALESLEKKTTLITSKMNQGIEILKNTNCFQCECDACPVSWAFKEIQKIEKNCPEEGRITAYSKLEPEFRKQVAELLKKLKYVFQCQAAEIRNKKYRESYRAWENCKE